MNDDLTPSLASSALDFGAYDLDGLRDDVRSIVDVSGAISAVTRWTFGAGAIGFIATWLVFQARIESVLAAVVFAVVGGICAMPFGAAIGGWLLARARLNKISAAAGQVVAAIGRLHVDILAVRAGSAETSVQQVAVSLLREAVFPIVFGTVNTTAEGLLGPFGSLASRVTRIPLSIVEQSVVTAIEALPDRQIGELVDGAVGALQVDDAAQAVAGHYDTVRSNLTSIVTKASRTSLIAATSLLVAAAMPVTIWWLIGWAIT